MQTIQKTCQAMTRASTLVKRMANSDCLQDIFASTFNSAYYNIAYIDECIAHRGTSCIKQ